MTTCVSIKWVFVAISRINPKVGDDVQRMGDKGVYLACAIVMFRYICGIGSYLRACK